MFQIIDAKPVEEIEKHIAIHRENGVVSNVNLVYVGERQIYGQRRHIYTAVIEYHSSGRDKSLSNIGRA